MKIARLTRNFAAAVLGSAALAMSSPASAIVVGGVDFGALGTIGHLETTTLAETLITGTGQTLTGYGVVNTVNGSNAYAAGQQLYFVFSYQSASFSATEVGFTGGQIDVYLGSTFNLLNQSSAANLAIIQSYTPWVRLLGHTSAFTNPAGAYTLGATGTLTGSTLSFSGSGLVDVDLSNAFGIAGVAAFLNPSNIPDLLGGFADIALTTSANNLLLNPFDNVAGCRDGTAAAGQWCLAGSADLRGTTVVPEPATAVLLGVALLGLGAASRKRAKK